MTLPALTPDLLIAGLLLLPLIAASTTVLTGKWDNLRDTLSIATGIVTAFFAISLFRHISAGGEASLSLSPLPPASP